MIQTTKRCLRKSIGSAKLAMDEFLTAVVEIEMIVNSRPLSYLSANDLEGPLTQSHLLIGHRVLSLPSNTEVLDEEQFELPITHDELTCRMKHLAKSVGDFWRRWRSEYLIELRDAH